MTDNTLPAPTQRTPFVDRFRNISDAWWPWMSKLLDTVRSTATGLSSVEVEVDQVNGSWTLNLNAGGELIGRIKADGSGGISVIDILATSFRISQLAAGAGGAATVVFEVGTVNGAPAIVLKAPLLSDDIIAARMIAADQIIAEHIAAGQIQAEHIDVDTLSAIAADVGLLTAGVIQSADGKMVIDLDDGFISITT